MPIMTLNTCLLLECTAGYGNKLSSPYQGDCARYPRTKKEKQCAYDQQLFIEMNSYCLRQGLATFPVGGPDMRK